MKENNNPTLAVFGKSKKIHSTIVDAIFKKNHLSTDKIKDNLEVTEEISPNPLTQLKKKPTYTN